MRCMSPLMAQSGHPSIDRQCPFLGVKRTSMGTHPMSAFDPKRTLAAQVCPQASKPGQVGTIVARLDSSHDLS